MAKCENCGKPLREGQFGSICGECFNAKVQDANESRWWDQDRQKSLENGQGIHGGSNTLGCFYEWILNSTIIFAACAFVISLFGYFTADDPITEQINMGTLLISGAIVGLLTAVRWLMGAMSTHLANQAQIIQLMSKKDGDE